MNRKNRMAALASRASGEFFTYKFFHQKGIVIEDSLVLKVTTAGVHVIILKYGVEGVVRVDGEMEIHPETESAIINGTNVKTFDYLKVEIVTEMVDY